MNYVVQHSPAGAGPWHDTAAFSVPSHAFNFLADIERRRKTERGWMGVFRAVFRVHKTEDVEIGPNSGEGVPHS